MLLLMGSQTGIEQEARRQARRCGCCQVCEWRRCATDAGRAEAEQGSGVDGDVLTMTGTNEAEEESLVLAGTGRVCVSILACPVRRPAWPGPHPPQKETLVLERDAATDAILRVAGRCMHGRSKVLADVVDFTALAFKARPVAR